MDVARHGAAQDHTTLFLARRQLLRSPIERPAWILGDRWEQCLGSLRLAAGASDVVLVGPVAAALRGHPGQIPQARVGVIGRWRHQGAVIEQLMDAGAMMAGFDKAPRGLASRERWLHADGAAVSVGWMMADRDDEVDALLASGDAVTLPGGGQLHLPTAAQLRDRAAASPWPLDNALVPGLDAVLAVRDETRSDAVRPPGASITIRPRGAHVNRAVRPEHAEVTIPFTGSLPVAERRAILERLRRLVMLPGDRRSLRGIALTSSAAELTLTAAGESSVVGEWIASGDLVAAVVYAANLSG